MQKHNLHSVKSKPDEPVEKIYIEPEKQEAVNTIPVRLRIDAIYSISGKFSGRGYLFRGAGSVNDVDERDVEYLLSLRRGKACCGGGGGDALFELA